MVWSLRSKIEIFKKLLLIILDKKTYVRPKDLTSAAISLLKFDPNLQKYLKFVDVDEIKEHSPKDYTRSK